MTFTKTATICKRQKKKKKNAEGKETNFEFVSLLLSLSVLLPRSFSLSLQFREMRRYQVRVPSLPRGLRGVETASVGGYAGAEKEKEETRRVGGAKEGYGRASGGWRVEVTVTASSAAWANRCAHTRVRSIDPPLVAAVCASRVMTSEMTSSLAPFASRRRGAFRSSHLPAPRSQPPSPPLHTVRF